MAFEEYWYRELAAAPTGASLRFSGAASPSISRVYNQAQTSAVSATFSFWIKISTPTVGFGLADCRNGTTDWGMGMVAANPGPGFWWGDMTWSQAENQTGVFNYWTVNQPPSSGSFRDADAWYHVVVIWDSNNATSTDRVRCYVNNELHPFNNYFSSISAGRACPWTLNGYTMKIGGNMSNPTQGYTLANWLSVDGQQLPPTTFGSYNADGVWTPNSMSAIQTAVTAGGGWGGNGFALEFFDTNFTSGSNTWVDTSGNGNDFTASWDCAAGATASAGTDILNDSPLDNYGTFNPVKIIQNPPSSDSEGQYLVSANLAANLDRTLGDGNYTTTITLPSSGKYYFECQQTTAGTPNPYISFGIVAVPDTWNSSDKAQYNNGGAGGATLVKIGTNATSVAAPSWGAGYGNASDICGCAVDLDAGTVQFYLNGTLNANTLIISPNLFTYAPFVSTAANTQQNARLNFGQQPFAYTPPSGFEPLSTAQLAAAPIAKPSDNFQVVVGPGSTILNPTTTLTSQPAAATHFFLNSGNLSWTQPCDGSMLFANELVCGNNQVLTNTRTTAASNTPSFNGSDYIEFSPPLTLTGNCFIRWGNTTAGVSTELGPSAIVTYGDGTTATTPQLPRTNTLPPGTTTYGNYVIDDQYAGLYTLDNTKTLKRIEIAATMPGRYQSNLYLLVINNNPVIANPQVLNVVDGTVFSNGDIVHSTADNKSGVVTATTASSVTINSLSDWNGTYTAGEGIYQYLCSSSGYGPFQYGMAWVKDRVNANQHQFVDSVRGGNLSLMCPAAGAEGAYVAPSGDSVAWCWRAGNGAPVVNNAGTITSTVSANTTAGFSIITWTGTGADGSYGHGLGVPPSMIIHKRLDGASDFDVYHQGLPLHNPTYDVIYLNLTSAQNSPNNNVFRLDPTSTVIYTGSALSHNVLGATYVDYAWAPIPGYSAFDSYVGNNNTDGPFVYTGFKPAWLLIKSATQVSNWEIYDNKRNVWNPESQVLQSNLTNAESSIGGSGSVYNYGIDFLANGFKIRTNDSNINSSGQTYIYAAFAENPFGGSNVAPATAR